MSDTETLLIFAKDKESGVTKRIISFLKKDESLIGKKLNYVLANGWKRTKLCLS